MLTDFLATHRDALLALQCAQAIFALQELYEPVRLLDRDLRKLAISVEYVEQIAFRDALGRKVTYAFVSCDCDRAGSQGRYQGIVGS